MPTHRRRSRSSPRPLDAGPREQSGQRFQEQIRALTRRQAPRQLREGIERITPALRGWGYFSRQAEVRRLFPRLAGWVARRRASFLAKRWRNPMGRQSPTRWLIEAFGLVRLTHRLPGLVRR